MVVIDNYDSFTYNLVQYLGMLGAKLAVFRNDEIDLPGLEKVQLSHLIISPGPCTPTEAGISVSAIRHFAGRIPILGVCLGHQCLGEAFGGRVIRAPRLMHGKTSLIYHDGRDIFQGIPSPFEATRYHSLIVERDTLPDCLEIAAQTAVGEIMGLRHKRLAVFGVQFHPESILTSEGMNLLQNFIKRRRGEAG
ncbi:MAG: aminodeoxychorismate/anthranilate synthase component II [Deltaproteobacteria bacterium]|nr:aminodeoxychorismate/anthranilate synthase component II [Deltaproteobacteria bacterium]